MRRRKDGTPFAVSLSISPVRDASGRIVAAAGFARDITERRAFESAQYLAAIVENSDDAIVSKDLDGKILSWNDAATQMYGYTAEEAIGQPIDIVIPDDPDRRQEELEIRARIARGERIQHYETIRRRKDGTRFEVSLSISPVRDASGRIVAAAGFARDISERRVFESAQYLAAIVENSDDAIVSMDLAGKILSWNDAATRMYGYTAEEAHGPADRHRHPRGPGPAPGGTRHPGPDRPRRADQALRDDPPPQGRHSLRGLAVDLAGAATPRARSWRRPGSPATSPSAGGSRTSAAGPPGCSPASPTSARTTSRRRCSTSCGTHRPRPRCSARTRPRT